MGCELGHRGCRICPGMWIAGAMLVGMLLQSSFHRNPRQMESRDLSVVTDQSAENAASNQKNGP